MARCIQFRLTADKLAVRQARMRVREFGELPRQTVADAELVISELVANSLLHAHLRPGDELDLTLALDADHLRIEVDDHGSFSGRPRGRRGIGLRVLDALCDDWRADCGRVLASIRIPPADGASPGPPQFPDRQPRVERRRGGGSVAGRARRWLRLAGAPYARSLGHTG